MMVDPWRSQADPAGMVFGYVAFADGSRYERMPLPWVREPDWPRIGGEIGRFNAAASRASQE